jgi:hypothetical protein
MKHDVAKFCSSYKVVNPSCESRTSNKDIFSKISKVVYDQTSTTLIIHISSLLANLKGLAMLGWYMQRIQEYVFSKLQVVWQSYWTKHNYKWNKGVWWCSLQECVFKGNKVDCKRLKRCHEGRSSCHNKYGYNHIAENIDSWRTKHNGIVYSWS